jgi:hypothetical protein
MSVAQLESPDTGYSLNAYLGSLSVQNQITQGDGSSPVVSQPGIVAKGNDSTSGAGIVTISNNLSTPQYFTMSCASSNAGGLQQGSLDLYSYPSTGVITQVARIAGDGTLNYFTPASFNSTLSGLAKTVVVNTTSTVNLDSFGNNTYYTSSTAGIVITVTGGLSAKGQCWYFSNVASSGNVSINLPGKPSVTLNADTSSCIVRSIDNGSGGTALIINLLSSVSS